jgi:hypothetical protein
MLTYTDARYFKFLSGEDDIGIFVKIHGIPTNVPIDPANTDYANMMVLVAEGKLVIAPAEASNV